MGPSGLQIANPSTRGVTIPAHLALALLSTASATDTPELRISAVAASPKNKDESAAAREALEPALAKAFADTTFSPEQVSEVINLCAKYRPVFSLSADELGCYKIPEATFPLQSGTRPVDRAPYRTSPRLQKQIDDQVDKLLKQGIIEERTSAWGSPVSIVSKADGSPRFCVDYRNTLNRHLVRKTWPMPNIETHLDTVGGAKFITVADVQSDFHQLPVADSDIESTAFVTSKGKYCFKRMPFGVCNAPWLYQHMMSLALGDIGSANGLLCYMDDIIACSSTWEAHMLLLEGMFSALQAAGLTLKQSKLQFGSKQVKYLGHVISEHGITIGDDRIKAISDLPDPKNIKELRSLFGTLNFVRRFVPEYAEVTAPLVELTKKQHKQRREFEKHWGTAPSEAVTQIKKLSSSPPVLHFPDYSEEFIVHADASEAGVGAFLAQNANEGSDKPDLEIIAYFSKRFTKGQKHHSATMPHLRGKHFKCVTDHAAFTHLYYMLDTSNMLTRWAIALQSLDFTVERKPGKSHVVPDTLSRLFGDIPEDTTQGKTSLSDVLPSQPTLASICRNVPQDGQPYRPLTPRAYEVHYNNLNEHCLVRRK